MEFQAQLDVLERRVHKLRIDYERFLAGAIVLPPDDDEAALAIAVRDLRVQTRTAADGFRLSALEARFNTFREHFKKRVREREIGLRPRPGVAVESRPDPLDGVTVSREVDPQAAAVLYQALYGHSRSPKVDPDSFQRYLERQVSTLHERTGCTAVRLRLVERDGKMTLRARPVDPQSEPRPAARSAKSS